MPWAEECERRSTHVWTDGEKWLVARATFFGVCFGVCLGVGLSLASVALVSWLR